jgi:hypothetical protein
MIEKIIALKKGERHRVSADFSARRRIPCYRSSAALGKCPSS